VNTPGLSDREIIFDEFQLMWSQFTNVTDRQIDRQTDDTRYDTIAEFNVDWKAEYSALSSTRSQKKKLKQTTPVPL